jgi:hypothetical protein
MGSIRTSETDFKNYNTSAWYMQCNQTG